MSIKKGNGTQAAFGNFVDQHNEKLIGSLLDIYGTRLNFQHDIDIDQSQEFLAARF